MMTRKKMLNIGLLVAFGVGCLGAVALAQDGPTRSVKGQVTDESERTIENAVVQLKNTKTLQVKSFLTDKQGQYYFHGLDPNVDYQIQARHGDMESRTRTVSTFDDRSEVIYNFTLKREK